MGFPTRTGRAAYGPDPINARPVRDPRKQLDGETVGRLMFWQLGAIGLTAPQAWFCASVAADITLGAHAEAFQPRAGTGPTLTRAGAGVYTFSFAAQYPDEQGVPRVLNLHAGTATAMGPIPAAHGQIELNPDACSGTIRFWDLAATFIDPVSFFAVLW